MKIEDVVSPPAVKADEIPVKKEETSITRIPYMSKGKSYEASIYLDLPSAAEDAMKLYATIDECIYTTKHLGDSGQVEIMTCECRSDHHDGINHACGEDSDCINRLTSVECRNDCSTCGKDCQNQRFQRKSYAPLDIILTENKGFGLRAQADIPAGTFIIEYVGEVIDDKHWRRRMENYEKEGVKHFYFMMLQKGELIDATKKGSWSRFANHSCRPNCVVEKWVVKDKLCMGIFSSRQIFRGEEITFDYNVDRFGAEAQPCYCGESNCIGFLGGKTQTEAANKLPQLLIDALGLNDEDEDNWITTTAALKKTKKKKGAKSEINIDEEYAKHLPVKPIESDHVSKVMSSLLQTQEEWLVAKLIERIHMTSEKSVDSQVMRMHGYQIFGTLLKQWHDHEQIITCILEILSRWPRVTKNKISSSQIEVTVTEISKDKESSIAANLAKALLREWSELKMAYRIPRRERVTTDEVKKDSETTGEVKKEPGTESPAPPEKEKEIPDDGNTNIDVNNSTNNGKDVLRLTKKRPSGKDSKKSKEYKGRKLPKGWFSAVAPSGQTYYYNSDRSLTTWEWPGDDSKMAMEQEKLLAAKIVLERKGLQADLQKIIQEASKSPATLVNDESPSKNQENGVLEKNDGSDKKSESRDKKSTSSIEHALRKTLAHYVPNQIARYEKELGHDNIKRIAKEIVQILMEKETRPGHEVKQPHEMTESRKAKVKKFIREYIDKVLTKYRAKHGKSRDGEMEEPASKKIKTNGN